MEVREALMPAKGQFKPPPPGIAELYASGLTFAEIGKRFGVAGITARAWALRLGVTPRTCSDYRTDALQRAWDRIERKGPSDCWEWQGSTNRSGYGMINDDRRSVLVHRLVLLRHLGLESSHLDTLHSCDNRRCCNPEHMSLGTNAANVADKIAKGRQYRPPHGSASPHAKLSDEQVRAIRRELAAGDIQRVIAARYGVSRSLIREIKLGAAWAHVQ
jgi:DNA-binding transcriptional regulator YiaG